MNSKIMVVDDEEAVRSTWEQILKYEGYEVIEFGSGEAALAELQNSSYDMVLLDLKMPGMDGIDVLKVINQVAPETRVILLTGHGSLESAIEALRLGAQDYILKPASTKEILDSVARGLAKKAEQQRKRLLIEQLDNSLKSLKDVEGLYYSPSGRQQVFAIENGVMVDLARREVWRGSQRISLTTTEGKLMRVLLENQGRVLSHREMVMMVQGFEASEWEAPEVLRPLISRLRQKLQVFPNGKNWIKNVRGAGYVLDITG